jgi:hypothetical protein
MVSQEVRHIGESGFVEDSEVTAVNDVHPKASCGCHQLTEIRVQFGCPTGDIQCLCGRSFQESDNIVDGLARHLLATIRPRINVTVQT